MYCHVCTLANIITISGCTFYIFRSTIAWKWLFFRLVNFPNNTSLALYCTNIRDSQLAIGNGSVRFRSLKLKPFKTELFEKKRNWPRRTTKPFKPNHYKTCKQMVVEIFKSLVQNSIFQITIQAFKNQNSNLFILLNFKSRFKFSKVS